MDKKECFDEVKRLFEEYGAEVLCMQWLFENNYNLYHYIGRLQDLQTIAEGLGLYNEFDQMRKKNVTKFTKDECLVKWNIIISNHGVDSICERWLGENAKIYPEAYKLLKSMQSCKLSYGEIAKHFNISDEQKKSKMQRQVMSCNRVVWNDETLDKFIRDIIKKYDCFPPQQFLKASGYSNFVNAMFRARITVEDIEKKYGGTHHRVRLFCRNKMLWNSYPETACSNFFWSRGITVFKGSNYPEGYTEMSGRDHGIFDMEIIATIGELKGQRIYIEIWGESPNGRREEYSEKRKNKELFNKDNPCFLGIEYIDCYNENCLINTFEPYIGKLPIIRYENERDKMCPSVMWSLFDEVLIKAKKVCENTDDGMLPCTNWFSKIKKFKDRKIQDWEEAIFKGSSVTFGKDIRKIGFNVVREALNQSLKRQDWTFDTATNVITTFENKYSSLYSVYKILGKKETRTADEDIQLAEAKHATNAYAWLRKEKKRKEKKRK